MRDFDIRAGKVICSEDDTHYVPIDAKEGQACLINGCIGTFVSVEGDIITTPCRVDDEGNKIYVDCGIDDNGNQVLKEMKDIALISDISWFKQVVYNRIKTQNPDWYHHPTIGANLEDLIGEQNTRANADIGSYNILKSLTYDGFINPKDANIRSVPVDSNNIIYFIRISNPYTITLYASFGYEDGIKEFGVV